MKEIKINLKPNSFGYYGISYFDENKKFQHSVVKTLEEAHIFVAEKSAFEAERTFKGSKFEVWSY